MDKMELDAFGDSWVRAWNADDLERILGHFTDDVVFSSPLAATLVPGSDGVVRGKAALRQYWQAGLEHLPDLHFEVLGLYGGVDTVVINYRNERGGLACEVLVFDGDLVAAGHATYAL